MPAIVYWYISAIVQQRAIKQIIPTVRKERFCWKI